MTQNILVNTGEEYVVRNDLEGVTVDIGLYDDSTDAITDPDNISDISTEPASGNYSRQSVTVSTLSISGDWGFETDATVTFDFSDVAPGDPDAQDFDTGFFVVNFESDEAGDSGASDNLFGNFGLSQTYNSAQFDEFEIQTGDAEFTLD